MSIMSTLICVFATILWGAFTSPSATAGNIGLFVLTLVMLIVAELLDLLYNRGLPLRTKKNAILAILQVMLLACGYVMSFSLSDYGTTTAIAKIAFSITSFIGAVYQAPYDVMKFTVNVKRINHIDECDEFED